MRPVPPSPPPAPVLSTQMRGCDELLGGGLRESLVYLIFGEPGGGKSTLVAQWCAAVGGTYITTEQAEKPVKDMIARVRPRHAKPVRVVACRTVNEGIRAAGDAVALVVDSISGLGDSRYDQKVNLDQCIAYARKLHRPVMVISHVDKQGNLAGLKAIEHAPDAVLKLDGSRETRSRRLVALKIRGAKTGSVGLTMGDNGFEEGYQEMIALDRGEIPIVGSVLCPAQFNGQIVLADVCVVVAPGKGRIRAENIEAERARRLVGTIGMRWPAISQKIRKFDVTISADRVLPDPQFDAAIVVAILSAISNEPLNPVTVAWGAVPLIGHVRPDESYDDRADATRRLPAGAAILDPGAIRDIGSLWARVSSKEPDFPDE